MHSTHTDTQGTHTTLTRTPTCSAIGMPTSVEDSWARVSSLEFLGGMGMEDWQALEEEDMRSALHDHKESITLAQLAALRRVWTDAHPSAQPPATTGPACSSFSNVTVQGDMVQGNVNVSTTGSNAKTLITQKMTADLSDNEGKMNPMFHGQAELRVEDGKVVVFCRVCDRGGASYDSRRGTYFFYQTHVYTLSHVDVMAKQLLDGTEYSAKDLEEMKEFVLATKQTNVKVTLQCPLCGEAVSGINGHVAERNLQEHKGSCTSRFFTPKRKRRRALAPVLNDIDVGKVKPADGTRGSDGCSPGMYPMFSPKTSPPSRPSSSSSSSSSSLTSK